MNAAERSFVEKAPLVMTWLVIDFHCEDYHAAGILGNAGRESLGLTVLREIGQKPGRGGYGWMQWTGPRARSYLAWCRKKGLDWRSDAANYGYLKYELRNAYSYCISSLLKCKTVESATESFERTYERAGVPAIPDRIHWAKLALDAFRKEHPPTTEGETNVS